MSDLEIIKKIEDKYNIEIERVEKVDLGKASLEYSVNNLNQIDALNLFGCNFDDYSFLQELKNLTVLDLSYNEISDISFLQELKSLNSLYLRVNQIYDISFLQELKNLIFLDLNFNKISNISFLQELKNLIFLDLSFNKISNISFLKDLKKITSLNLQVNKISDITVLKDLLNLNSLILNNNQILDFHVLKGLVNLSWLGLSHNIISDSSFLEDLISLDSLNLSSTQISDISFLNNLVNLKKLNLSFNAISDITVLKSLVNLESLDLRANQITKLPLWITNFKNEIVWEDYSFNTINLYNNPIQHPPLEIVKQGKEAIKKYLSRKDVDAVLHEAKLTLVGNGGVGKTSLSVRLRDKNANLPDNDKVTKGIELKKWVFNKSKNYVAHIWDFGGQDQYYPVHNYFLTSGAVFVLVENTEGNHQIDYWLHTISEYAKDSPIIVVKNLFRGQKSTWDTEAFDIPEYNIVKNEDTSFFTVNLLNNKGLKKVEKEIKKQLQSLEIFNKKFPRTWVKVREEIKNQKHKNLISFKEFTAIYKNLDTNNVSDDFEIKLCASDFHKLGIIIYYDKKLNISDTVVLNPEWALQAIYKIIDDDKIMNGIVVQKDFDRIWSTDSEINEHRVLKNILQYFRIAFPLNDNRYLIPKHQKNIEQKDIWKIEENHLSIRYKFKAIPADLVNQISAELYKHTNENEVWKNAVNLYKGENKCQLIKQNKNMLIKAVGANASEITNLIKHTTETILETYDKKFSPSIEILCSCYECVNNDEPLYVSEEDLKRKIERKGLQSKWMCNRSEEVFMAVDMLYNLGQKDFIHYYKKKLESKSEERIIKKIKDSEDSIISKIDDRFDELVALSNSNKDDIVNVVGKFNANQTKELATKFISVSEQLLKTYKGKDLEKYKTYLQETKNSSNWETKLKLSIPFIKLIGIDISTEVKFNLVNWIKTNYKKYEDDIYEIMGVTNTKQFREQKRD